MKAIKNINWELLSRQKLSLVEVITNNDFITKEEMNSLDGILHLIDAMEDEHIEAKNSVGGGEIIVSQQRELLIAYHKYNTIIKNDELDKTIERHVDQYLSNL